VNLLENRIRIWLDTALKTVIPQVSRRGEEFAEHVYRQRSLSGEGTAT